MSFDKDACHFSERAVSDQTTYHVTYDGSPIDHLLCSMMKFYGGDSSRINSYRVCVTLLFYKDPDCAIWFGYILTLSETAVSNLYIYGYTCEQSGRISEFYLNFTIKSFNSKKVFIKESKYDDDTIRVLLYRIS